MAVKKIKTNIIIEVLGSPKDHVNETLNLLIKRLKEDIKLSVAKTKVFDAVPVEKTPMWTGFVEAEVHFKKFEDLTGFCFDYYPSSIEIVEPEKVDINAPELSMLFNDIAARLHKTHKIVRDMHAQNRVMAKELSERRAAEKK